MVTKRGPRFLISKLPIGSIHTCTPFPVTLSELHMKSEFVYVCFFFKSLVILKNNGTDECTQYEIFVYFSLFKA